MAWGGQLEFDIAGSIGWGAKTTGVVDLALSEVVCNLVWKGLRYWMLERMLAESPTLWPDWLEKRTRLTLSNPTL